LTPDKTDDDTTLLNLALQGGGAHGAFTWGVLDRLLEEETFAVNAVSGTSAGAMNAAALLSGLTKGGREEARRSLETFWRKVSSRSRFSPFNLPTAQAILGGLGIDQDALPALFGSGMHLFSPYDLNPGGFNPLGEIIRETIDLEAIACADIGLYVTTTHVATGEARIFSNRSISVDILLASACLPALFHAVEIDGDFHWDGGYTGNPSLMPLVHETGASDLLLIQTSPTWRPEVPQDARQIALREREISFNVPLIKELRLLAELQHQARQRPPLRRSGFLSGRSGKRAAETLSVAETVAGLRLHRITSAGMNGRSGQSKLNSSWGFLKELRDEGRHAAEEFLAAHGRDLGNRSSLDLSRWRQCPDQTNRTRAKAC